MSELIPRFEFRTFAQTFGLVTEKIRRYAACQDISESAETYLLVIGVEDQNLKVRDGRLEIKRLIEQRDGLERWEPIVNEVFPLSRTVLYTTFFSTLYLKEAELSRSVYSPQELFDDVVRPRRNVWRACVWKRRFRFVIDDCSVEIDEVLINGAAIGSVAVESADANVALAVMDKVGLTDYANLNYPRALRRVMGLEPLPDEDRYA